ncbi:AhpC/TSA family protein [Enhygromyxa salina]|uniref:AhpC/TSA family protein n=1 Tax=Enhygromyxa salina TaxID=215803 RepID=A0A2S9XS31_9BACT|nr:redoxin domain-containing protein [Enhygromyxa salina]PRP95674.1 AhpC/TSA family protein [Enhygromyxa salina]
MRRLLLAPSLLLVLGQACQRPPTVATVEPGPTRLPILTPEYGAHPDHPAALGPGDRLAALSLPLADGGQFELANARGAGPVILAWIGGAEHEALTTWARSLDRGLAELDGRGATLVFVRPLGAEAALRWAVEVGLQTSVAGDPEAELLGALELVGADEAVEPELDFAVVVIGPDGAVAYRKFGGRRPELDELLAVLDGAAENLRCCPDVCVGEPCEGRFERPPGC